MGRPWPWLLLFIAGQAAHAQNISTSMQINPLQYINLSRLAQGSAPIPLKDAHISYDPAKRAIVIFGGESSSGTPTQQTYILSLDNLQWRVPMPPDAQRDVPPARSAGIYGQDFASNYRSGLLVWGGKGNGGAALDDLWYYHYQNEFWTRIPTSGDSTPGPRWNPAGGSAARSVIQNVETYLWVTGGQNQTSAYPFDDIWQVSITGLIAAGSNTATGVWTKVPTSPTDPNKPQNPRIGLAGTIVPGRDNVDREGTLVVFGGCDLDPSNPSYDASCGQRDAHSLTFPTDSQQTTAQWNSAANCPPGQYAAALAPNRNSNATAFSSQVFLFPGSIDKSRWNTSSSTRGEIGVLLANSGIWARVIPSGDPDSTPTHPSAKEGVAIYSHPTSLTGQSGWSETIIFGGKDIETGELSNELWLLRAYDATIQSSDDEWFGYGNGQLQGGLSATGTGVKVSFLSQCADPIAGTTTSTSAAPGPTSSGPPTLSITPHVSVFDTSPIHRIISPVSIAIFLFSVLLFRSSSGPSATLNILPMAIASLLGVVAYVVGIVGFGVAVSRNADGSSASSSNLRTRAVANNNSSSTKFLGTSHSRASLALFIILYGLLPILGLATWLVGRHRRRPQRVMSVKSVKGKQSRPALSKEGRKSSDETKAASTTVAESPATIDDSVKGVNLNEKLAQSRGSDDDGSVMMMRKPRRESNADGATNAPGRTSSDSTNTPGSTGIPDEVVSADSHYPPSRSRSRRQSKSEPHDYIKGGFIAAAASAWKKQRTKSEGSAAPPSSFPQSPPKFEVTNRPRRASHGTTSTQTANGNANHHHRGSLAAPSGTLPRNPSDLSWLERRRSLTLYGEIDLALAQQARAVSPPLHSSIPLVGSTHLQTGLMVRPHQSIGSQQLDVLSTNVDGIQAIPIPPRLPSPTIQICFNIALQLGLLFAITFWVVTFAIEGIGAGLAITIVFAVIYYIGLIVLAWMKRPRRSMLVVAISRLKGEPISLPQDPSTMATHGGSPTPATYSAVPQHPYYHQAIYRTAHDDDEGLGGRPRSTESEPLDDDEDDDERQARMEEEMARRDVSIFTVPKRKLVVRNMG
ncbi:hypothetical protein FRC03_012661 [Tulasnella sp. 419]|nr:hypothetical protein FRC03_012661 [Tulasnella sp. 419]